MAETWRTGHKDVRTIYRLESRQPYSEGELIGVMDTPELAALVVDAVNLYLGRSGMAQDDRPAVWSPAPSLIDIDFEVASGGTPTLFPCGCNQSGAVHEWGDAGFCRRTLASVQS